MIDKLKAIWMIITCRRFALVIRTKTHQVAAFNIEDLEEAKAAVEHLKTTVEGQAKVVEAVEIINNGN
ncbi:MAG TPA: hypothetical protein VEA37_02180 [Flavobacterium sp.]|nr:hypothetical protein [Flavobacterium sp.]